jgi:hypothetical protein
MSPDREDLSMRKAHLLVAVLMVAAGCTGATASPPSETKEVPLPPPALVASATEPGEVEIQSLPEVTTDNKRQLLVAAGAAVVVSASSSYPGWPPSNATDGDIHTSWYSNTNDSAAKGASPFLQLEFPEASTVRRVTILGNRDPAFLKGYTILSGRVELLNREGRAMASAVSDGVGNRRDFDFRFAEPVSGVKVVRFTSLADQGNKNPYGDVAIAELQVE